MLAAPAAAAVSPVSAALLAQVLLGPGAFAVRDVGPLETTAATARTA